MCAGNVKCVLLADRSHELSEGIRGLLESEFTAVVMVANELSLIESAARLDPNVVVADLALAPGENFGWLRRLLKRRPKARVIVLSSYADKSVVEAAFEAGAMGVVSKREIGARLLEAVDVVLAGHFYGLAGAFSPNNADSGETQNLINEQ